MHCSVGLINILSQSVVRLPHVLVHCISITIHPGVLYYYNNYNSCMSLGEIHCRTQHHVMSRDLTRPNQTLLLPTMWLIITSVLAVRHVLTKKSWLKQRAKVCFKASCPEQAAHVQVSPYAKSCKTFKPSSCQLKGPKTRKYLAKHKCKHSFICTYL